jgi:hypothetical protein
MFIGVYLCLGSLVGWLGLALFSRSGRHVLAFSILSIVGLSLMMALFLAASAWAGLTTFGVPGDWNYPADYLQAGPLGWLIALIPLLGLLLPLGLAAWFAHRRAELLES